MTTPTAPPDGLELLLGPRQAEIMRLIWDHGSATLREVQQWLKQSNLAYTTIATLCTRLVEKGLLHQHIGAPDQHDRYTLAHVYTPLIAEADFVRVAVTQQLDGLLAHYPDLVCSYVAQHVQHAGAGAADGCANRNDFGGQDEHDSIEWDNSTLNTQHSELAAAQWEAEARRAQHQARLAIARYERAEARAQEWEAATHRAMAQALAAEEDANAIVRRVALQQHAAARSAPEYYAPAGVCRVCNVPIPDAPARRRDGLRVCAVERCKQEARRRDRAAKQRRQRARWRVQREQMRTQLK